MSRPQLYRWISEVAGKGNNGARASKLAPSASARDEKRALVPVVFERGGAVFASSLDVAAFFGKEHRHVLRDIENLMRKKIGPKLGGSGFSPSEALDSYGRKQPTYDMTRDGFTLLVMGFTGAKALAWKLKYIEAFNRMEAEIRGRSPQAPVNLNDASTLRRLLLGYSEQLMALESKGTVGG